MDLCIKTRWDFMKGEKLKSFNPCFNGSMYKNWISFYKLGIILSVSILVLMDLCIKTITKEDFDKKLPMFQSLF